MKVPRRGSDTIRKQQLTALPFGKSRDDIAFFINAVGSPLLVVEKRSLTVRMGNRGAERFFAVGIDEFPGLSMERLVGGEANRMLGQIWSNAPAGVTGEPFLVRARIHEHERLLMVQMSKLVIEHEEMRLFTIVDAPPEGATALVSWQEKIIDMLNWLPFGFEIATTDDQIQFANSQFNALFGYSQHEIESIEDWWRLAYPDPDYRLYARTKWATEIASARAEKRDMTPFDLDVVTHSGARRTIQFRHRTIDEFNINLYLDVTSERAAARELKRLSETDPLTGVMNRRRFLEEAQLRYARRPEAGYCVLVLDIDHFKAINDSHGHAAGDTVLVEFARRCTELVAGKGIFARFGGEEFVALLDGSDAEGQCPADHIRDAIGNRPFMLQQKELSMTVSIGVARRARNETFEETLCRADEGLYEAKASGRNRVVRVAHTLKPQP